MPVRCYGFYIQFFKHVLNHCPTRRSRRTLRGPSGVGRCPKRITKPRRRSREIRRRRDPWPPRRRRRGVSSSPSPSSPPASARRRTGPSRSARSASGAPRRPTGTRPWTSTRPTSPPSSRLRRSRSRSSSSSPTGVLPAETTSLTMRGLQNFSMAQMLHIQGLL